MPYRDELSSFDKECESVAGARRAGIAILGSAVGLGYVVEKLLGMVGNSLDLQGLLYLSLLGLTVVTVGCWVWASGEELDQLVNWMDPRGYAPPQGQKLPGLVALEGSLLAAMLVTADLAKDVRWYSVFLTGLYVTAAFGTRYLHGELLKAFGACERNLGKEENKAPQLLARTGAYSRGLRALRRFHLERPHVGKHLVFIALGTVAFALALSGQVWAKTNLSAAAYVPCLIVLILERVVTWKWQTERDGELREAEALRAEAERALKEEERANRTADRAT